MNDKSFLYKTIHVSYTDDGDGDVVVLLHGFLESKNIWQPFISDIIKAHRLITVDLLGHGKTGCLGYIHTMEQMAEPIIALLEHLGIKQCTLFGHSMGGYVALAFAEKDPDFILKLGLINSTSREDSAERKKNRDRAILAVKDNPKRFIRMGIPNLFSKDNLDKYSEAIEQITHEALKTPIQGVIAALEGMKIRPDRSAFLKSLNRPKLLIASLKDPVLDFTSLKQEAEECQMNLVIFPDGHMSFVENRLEFSQQIVHFIE